MNNLVELLNDLTDSVKRRQWGGVMSYSGELLQGVGGLHDLAGGQAASTAESKKAAEELATPEAWKGVDEAAGRLATEIRKVGTPSTETETAAGFAFGTSFAILKLVLELLSKLKTKLTTK